MNAYIHQKTQAIKWLSLLLMKQMNVSKLFEGKRTQDVLKKSAAV